MRDRHPTSSSLSLTLLSLPHWLPSGDLLGRLWAIARVATPLALTGASAGACVIRIKDTYHEG